MQQSRFEWMSGDLSSLERNPERPRSRQLTPVDFPPENVDKLDRFH